MNKLSFTKKIMIALLLFIIFNFNLNLGIAILISVIFYSVANVIFNQNTESEHILKVIEKENNNNFQKSIEENRKIISKLYKYDSNLKESVKINLDKLLKLSEQIFENVKLNPKKIKDVKKVFTFYLFTIEKSLNLYFDLKRQRLIYVENNKTLNKIEELLETTVIVFEIYLEKSLEKNTDDLDVDIELLEYMLKEDKKLYYSMRRI